MPVNDVYRVLKENDEDNGNYSNDYDSNGCQ